MEVLNPLFYYKRLRDLLHFLADSKRSPFTDLSVTGKIASTVFLVFITLIFSLSSHVAVCHFLAPQALASFANLPSRFGPLGFFLLSVLLVPLVEETYYRLPLKFHPLFISLAGGIFFYRFISRHVLHILYYNGEMLLSRLAFAAFFACIVYFIISRPPVETFTRSIYAKHFRLVFYLVCCAFAWTHIFNFQASSYSVVFIPVITLPQFFLALTTGFVRMEYGFFYAFLLHAGYNSSSY